MYTLGIPKRQYRRATSVLGPESAEPIEYDSYKQDDGFWQFSFPEVDEYGFRDIVNLLKANGVTTIGADDQLTEKKIMKLSKLIRENLKTEGTMSIDVPPLGGGTGGPMGGGGTVKKPKSGRVKKADLGSDDLDSINEQGSPDDDSIIDILRDRLKRMTSKDYRGGGLEGCELSNHYLEEIKELIEDYDEETTMNRPSDLPAFGGLNEIYNSLTEQDPFQDLYDKQNPNDPKAIPGKHFPDDAAKKRMAQDAASLGKGSSGRITKVQKLKMSDIEDEVTIDQKYPSCYDSGDKCLDDVTISWGNESHTVSFEYDGIIDDFDNKGVEAEFMANSNDGKWQFILDVNGAVGLEYGNCNPCIQDYDWNELIIQDHPDDESHLDPEDRSDYDPRMDPAIRSDFDDPIMEDDIDEGTCGYGKDGKIGKKPAGPLQERFKKLAGIIK